MSRVAIINYGYGNLFSIVNSIESVGLTPFITNDADEISAADAVIIPGVGNFSFATKQISSFKQTLCELLSDGRIVFGICLGLQLLCRSSEEGNEEGLNLIDAEVKQIKAKIVPHIGWNTLSIQGDSLLLDGIDDDSFVYFVHSYYLDSVPFSLVKATSHYDSVIPAVIEDQLILGTQFHPEKSGLVGLRILENFAKLVRR